MSLQNLQERECRYKVALISVRDLMSLCFFDRLQTMDYLNVSVIDGLPEGTEVLTINTTTSPLCMQILLWNASWPVVPLGEDLPRLDTFTKVVRLKRLPDEDNLECYEAPRL